MTEAWLPARYNRLAFNSRAENRSVNRALAQKIVELFREDFRAHPAYFPRYGERDWRRTKRWLDSSGMALYFLEKLRALRLEGSIPGSTIAELEGNSEDRKLEVTERVQRFTRLVNLFEQHNIRFAVEKGIALVPGYCTDISLRFQVDFDFLVHMEDVERCRELLLDSGYRYCPTIEGEARFLKGDLRIPSIHDFYKPKQKHVVELHFDDSEATRAKLAAVVPHQMGSLVFPVLSPVDCFVEYVLHFVKHLRGGWVRTDALLEYRHFVRTVETNRDFWAEVQRRCAGNGNLREANAIMALLAQRVLGLSVAPELLACVNGTSAGIRRWVDRYAWRVLLAEYPGTKFHVLLDLESGRRRWLNCARMIFPSACRPNRIAETGTSTASVRQAFVEQSLFFLARCRYHIRESYRISYELLVWSCTADNGRRGRQGAPTNAPGHEC